MAYNFCSCIVILLKIIFFWSLLIFVNKRIILKLDNIFIEPLYENSIDFSKYKTNYKIIAIFYPDNYIKKYFITKNKIEEDIKLAKNHGIYGFAMIYNFTNNKTYDEILFNIFSFFNEINFPFFIIFNSDINALTMNVSSLMFLCYII